MVFFRENQRVNFSILSKEDLEKIHETTLKVLERGDPGRLHDV
jgi:trimethylamine:corrinoid methyltransferase-like protein